MQDPTSFDKDSLTVPRIEGRYPEDTRPDGSISFRAPISPIPRRSSRIQHGRKSSFPAVSITGPQQGGSLVTELTTRPQGSSDTLAHRLTPSPGDLQINDNYQRRYRRFSNVSDVVSRKLSTTIGWRSVSVQDIVLQAKSMCGQYIRARLKRNGIFNRRLGLQHLQSAANITGPTGSTITDVFAQLQMIGAELERLHPKLYICICRQVAVTMTNEKSVNSVLSSVARQLLKEVTWARIASLYCIAGGLAVDCVRQGHPEYIFGIVETMGLVVERDAATWIAQQGGWPGLLLRYRQSSDDDAGAFQMIALSVLCLIVLLLGAIFILRTIGKIAFGTGQTQI